MFSKMMKDFCQSPETGQFSIVMIKSSKNSNPDSVRIKNSILLSKHVKNSTPNWNNTIFKRFSNIIVNHVPAGKTLVLLDSNKIHQIPVVIASDFFTFRLLFNVIPGHDRAAWQLFVVPFSII